MKTLILHPTELSQWHALVNEAQASSRLILNENTESYLVFLLMRFVQEPQLLDSVVALDFLHALSATRRGKMALLRDVGDKSLLFSGLFSEMAQKKVSLNYFIDLGQAAYLSVGELHDEPQSAGLYYELSHEFLTMQRILQAMRGEYEHFAEMKDSVIVSEKSTRQ